MYSRTRYFTYASKHINTTTRPFSSQPGRSPFQVTPSQGPLIPQNEIVDEESCPGYNAKGFYPARVGEVIANRYQILVKVGWGTSSTVWFARDMRGLQSEPEEAVALKISNASSQADINRHREIEQHIATARRSHDGREILRTFLECFETTGPEGGKHLCMAYEPMREPFWLFRTRFRDRLIPLPLLKTYIRILLVGLDYLHTECKVVHTDLKLDNIMLTFEDPEILGDILSSHIEESPMKYKISPSDPSRHVYRCHNDFGPLRGLKSIPQIADFGLAARLVRDDDYGFYPIQADPYCAPEVILGCGWRMSADIWNFGLLLWDIIEGKELFRQIGDSEDRYDARAHLAEMIALLGPPPQNLIARYHSMRDSKLAGPSVKGAGSELCKDAGEFYGGPFFGKDGKFLYEGLIPDRRLVDSIPTQLVEEEDRENFLSLVKMMLAWLPEERKTARELAEHPFLQLE
ncbi:CMGC/SRPK protein kinase [Blastomyces dermatitidis ER-3]|uniref:CMGC/SRPK protein kinase n=2 Tax=Blastomyces TaxID=229219 RepID=A0A179UR58_BLAGS|nr:CMGC/SRPK protein kinase [Blastomyces gilchristii SLH14081]XP_045277096.1 CMGC/SRPK protein kinase [Blastomyces dermatitidis ER-3]EEQ90345.2 CMGC/SRPK protein kinase [Blastomyces dermatitidis ER-3]EQL29030.1 CMGC/SRPK protein kinase [Blastomyces dermatitidis ATCC 26199]OAT10350.1 CMGC/SRPK protein kinase [Blastomyces gilchristii SLH14081]